jgi:hypothetical protein
MYKATPHLSNPGFGQVSISVLRSHSVPPKSQAQGCMPQFLTLAIKSKWTVYNFKSTAFYHWVEKGKLSEKYGASLDLKCVFLREH